MGMEKHESRECIHFITSVFASDFNSILSRFCYATNNSKKIEVVDSYCCRFSSGDMKKCGKISAEKNRDEMRMKVWESRHDTVKQLKLKWLKLKQNIKKWRTEEASSASEEAWILSKILTSFLSIEKLLSRVFYHFIYLFSWSLRCFSLNIWTKDNDADKRHKDTKKFQ